MAEHLTPQTIDALINQALAIEDEQAQEAGAMGFMARAMVQATLPYRAVAGNEFERRNGAFTLTLQAPSKIGLPYGSIPCLLLAWVTTEAVQTKSRELELGDSMSVFMAELGLTLTGGANGSITKLKNQTRRLFSATVTASHEDDKQIADMGIGWPTSLCCGGIQKTLSRRVCGSPPSPCPSTFSTRSSTGLCLST